MLAYLVPVIDMRPAMGSVGGMVFPQGLASHLNAQALLQGYIKGAPAQLCCISKPTHKHYTHAQTPASFKQRSSVSPRRHSHTLLTRLFGLASSLCSDPGFLGLRLPSQPQIQQAIMAPCGVLAPNGMESLAAAELFKMAGEPQHTALNGD